MTLHDIAAKGYRKARKLNWADPEECLELAVVHGGQALWGKLYSPRIGELAKSEDPELAADFQEVLEISRQPIPIILDQADNWIPV